MLSYLGGESVASHKLREAGTAHWRSPNTGATNETGFSALPGGYRGYRYENSHTIHEFEEVGIYGYYWSTGTWSPQMSSGYSVVRFKILSTVVGTTVRCLKDAPISITGQLPLINTGTLVSKMETTAMCGGKITSDGGELITARGVCWNTSSNPTIDNSKTTDGTGVGNFNSNITGLAANTTYYLRAYATNSIGTAYGREIAFKTALSSVTDIDGNLYHTVTIGTQTWMVENLKTTKYRNGDSIPNVTDAAQWGNLITGAYCNYNNDVNNTNTYGRLYNWYAVSDTRNIAPTGWHVASNVEWYTLTDYLGGESWAGGKLKETGTTHWKSPNSGATNETGFTALPGGQFTNYDYYNTSPVFDKLGIAGTWWTLDLGTRLIHSDFQNVFDSNSNWSAGLSVRCLRD